MAKTPAELMRAARERAGKTQEQLAVELGFTQVQIAKWEAGKALPTTKDIRRVARAYGLRPDQLIPSESSAA
jgi:transcriptional regulator with XRE-family HTH domain